MSQPLAGGKPRWLHMALLLLVILPLYMLNAHWGTSANHDAVAANVASWQIVTEGTLDVSQHDVIRENLDQFDRWFVELPDGRIVSNRTLGLIALGVPSYALFGSGTFTVAPGTLVALLTTTLAVLIIWWLLIDLVGLTGATLSSLVLAIGTPTWWISSAQLWPHGPNQLWAALAVFALSATAYFGAGSAFAVSIITRPITAVSAAIAGLLESYQLRSWTPALKVGVVSGIGAGIVLIYNRVVFGAWSIAGGYFEGSMFTSGAFDASSDRGFSIAYYLGNVYEMFLGLPHGVLTVTPIIGLATVGSIMARKSIPRWAVSAALAAVGYLLVHAAFNRASGGLGIFYRYPLEALVLATPALAIGATRIWDSGSVGRRLVWGAAAISIFLQVLYVTYLVCFFDPNAPLCLAPSV